MTCLVVREGKGVGNKRMAGLRLPNERAISEHGPSPCWDERKERATGDVEIKVKRNTTACLLLLAPGGVDLLYLIRFSGASSSLSLLGLRGMVIINISGTGDTGRDGRLGTDSIPQGMVNAYSVGSTYLWLLRFNILQVMIDDYLTTLGSIG